MTTKERIAALRNRIEREYAFGDAGRAQQDDLMWLFGRLELADKLADVADMCRTYLCADEPLCELTDAIAAYRGNDAGTGD